jgi:hypothetical protein
MRKLYKETEVDLEVLLSCVSGFLSVTMSTATTKMGEAPVVQSTVAKRP